MRDADGTHDIRKCRPAGTQRGSAAILPSRESGCPWKENGPAAKSGNGNPRASRHYGRVCRGSDPAGIKPEARSKPRWAASRTSAKRISSKDPNRQAAEIHARRAMMKRSTALGGAEVPRAAQV